MKPINKQCALIGTTQINTATITPCGGQFVLAETGRYPMYTVGAIRL